MIRVRLAPFTRAACTNSWDFRERTLERTIRDSVGAAKTTKATTRLKIPVPMTATIRIASRMPGKANMTSISRMATVSVQPPK